jgi:hypothetical protein
MTWLRALAAAAGVAVLGWLVWEIGPDTLGQQFRTLSWRLPVLFLPYALVAILDAAGWRYAFPGRLPSLPLLVAVRLAGEAVNVTTPTATLGGEPVKAWLLTRARVPFEDGLVSVVVARPRSSSRISCSSRSRWSSPPPRRRRGPGSSG